MKLSGRNTLITGGSQGLGRVIVEAFLAEGANVVFCARTAADVAVTQGALNSQLKTGQQLIGLTCDIADPTSVAALFARAAQLGPLHVVVNNAGIYGPIGPTEEVALTDWTQAWQVNVTGTLLVCQQAIRAMKPRRAGKNIEPITSISMRWPPALSALDSRRKYSPRGRKKLGLNFLLKIKNGRRKVRWTPNSPRPCVYF